MNNNRLIHPSKIIEIIILKENRDERFLDLETEKWLEKCKLDLCSEKIKFEDIVDEISFRTGISRNLLLDYQNLTV